jgi:nucleoside-diphosphate-sugar epimerase
MINERLGWEPSITLKAGLEKTYAWIYDQMKSGSSKDSLVNRY